MKNKYYGMTLEEFMLNHADRFCDYDIADEDVEPIEVATFSKRLANDEHLDKINTWGRIDYVVENEEECTIHMKSGIYFRKG